MQKNKSQIQFEPNEGGLIPRLVEASFNIISILDVNEKSHGFRVIVRIAYQWDCRPLSKIFDFFRPVMLIDNVRSIEKLHSMYYYNDKELTKIAQHAMQNNQPGWVADYATYCVDFVTRFELRSFPFDLQVFTLSFSTEYPQLCTFTQVCAKHPDSGLGIPLVTDDGGEIIEHAIRGTLRSFSLSNWVVLTADKTFSDGSREEELNKRPELLINYRFGQLYKQNRSNAQYVKISYLMQRKYTNTLFGIVAPSFLLSFASLSTFSLKYNPDAEARLGILFTIILTIIANQYTIHEELPKLPYLTWVDYALKAYELFVYLLIFENAILSQVSGEEQIARADQIVFYFSLAFYIAINLALFVAAWILLEKRKPKVVSFTEEAGDSFDLEQKRLFQHVYSRPDLYKPWRETIKEERVFFPVSTRSAEFVLQTQYFLGKFFTVKDYLERLEKANSNNEEQQKKNALL